MVVATTDGPSTVRRITPEDPALRSVVCLAGTAEALPISAEYDAFVRRPTGVVERDTGHGVYRVDVDRPIDSGRSWQLGLYLAHRLKAADRLAEDDQPAEAIVWATGTVDTDLNIGPVERVADKARRSVDLIRSGPPVLSVAAAACADSLPAGSEALAADRMETVLHRLHLTPPATGAQGGRRRLSATVLLAILLIGTGAAAWIALRPPDPAGPPAREMLQGGTSIAGTAAEAPLPFDPRDVVFDVLESRPRDGVCAPGATVDPAIPSPLGVCAVVFRARNAGRRPARIRLYGAVQGSVREYASRRRHSELVDASLAPGESATVRVQPPDWVRRALVVRGLLVVTQRDNLQVDRALTSIDLLSAGELDALAGSLRDLGADVREIFHRVTPAR